MTQATLDGVSAKIDRAQYHFLELKTSLDSFHRTEQKDQLPAFDHKPERQILDISIQNAASNPQWPLMVGDLTHNLRSALDHLVFQLALVNRQPHSCCAKTAFPITVDEAAFQKARDRAEPFVSRDAFTVIETLQPYQAAKRAGRDARNTNLWIISELDVIDKHRMLIVAAEHFRTREIRYTVNGATTVLPGADKWQRFENGAQIGSIDLSAFASSGAEEMRVHAQTEMLVLFSETGCCDGMQVLPVMHSCIRSVSGIVETFGRFFKT